MKCLVTGELLYKQLKGMFELSGVQPNGTFIVQLSIKGKDLVLSSCLCSPDVRELKKADGANLGVYLIKEPSAYEMYYLKCQTVFKYEERAIKPVYFVVNKKVLKQFEEFRRENVTIALNNLDLHEILFIAGTNRFVLDLVKVEYEKGAKDKEAIDIQKKRDMCKPEYSLDLKYSQFVGLFDDLITPAISWSMLKVISGSIYIGNNYVYAIRKAYGICFKTEKFQHIISHIENVLYTYIDENTKQMIYRVPCYVIARLRELCRREDTVRLTVAKTGVCNITFVVNDWVRYVWSWDLCNVTDVLHILSYYNLRNGSPNNMLRGYMTDISSGKLREIARLGLNYNKQMEYGTLVYLGADNVIRIKPASIAKKGVYNPDATMQNVYNFPKVALNTVFLQNVIKVLAGDKKSVPLRMGKIDVDVGDFGALYLQTKDEEITAVVLPVILRDR